MPALVLMPHTLYTLQEACYYTSACQQGRNHDELLAMQVQASIQHHLSFRNEAYILTLHAHTRGALSSLTKALKALLAVSEDSIGPLPASLLMLGIARPCPGCRLRLSGIMLEFVETKRRYSQLYLSAVEVYLRFGDAKLD